MTFKGSVRFNLFIDQVALKPNLSIKSYVDLSVRESRVQDTRKIFFPALSYGYIPHISQTIDNTNSGQIISARPVALPARFNKGIEDIVNIRLLTEMKCNLQSF